MTWMTTASGLEFDTATIDTDDINVSDIAHHLATSTRFNGAALRPYSVAEHSLLVCEIAERDLGMRDPSALLAALMHDAHEAYFGDVIQPVKAQLGERAALIEARLERAVHRRYGLITPSTAYREQIRRADLMALATERRDLLPRTPTQWTVLTGIEPAEWVNLRDRDAFTWQDWYRAFCNRFNELNYARVLRGGHAISAATEEH